MAPVRRRLLCDSGKPIAVQRDGKPVLVDARKVKTVREQRESYGKEPEQENK